MPYQIFNTNDPEVIARQLAQWLDQQPEQDEDQPDAEWYKEQDMDWKWKASQGEQ